MENKIRGKRKDNGEWIYGNLVYMHSDGSGATWTTGIQMISGDGYRQFASVNVQPESVGQYTGLKDKNGKEIFEGDIVELVINDVEVRRFEVKIKTVVRELVSHPSFIDKTAKIAITGIVFEWNGFELFPCVDSDGKPDNETMMIVIGNIYENIELL